MMKNNRLKWLVVVVFALIAFLFLGNTFQANVTLQGPDTSYGVIHMRHLLFQKSNAIWDAQIWLGNGWGVVTPRLYYFLIQFVSPDTQIVPLTYLITMIIGMGLLFAFLSELGLSLLPSLFGALMWGMTPHIISLVNGAHVGLSELFIWAPAVLLFMTLGMKRKNPFWVQIVSLVVTGISWAFLMIADPQRGLYLSIVAGLWFIFLLLKENKISLSKEKWKEIFYKKVILHALRVVVIGGVLLLTYASNLSWWLGSDLIKGQAVGVTQKNDEQTKTKKWKFASSYSQDPLELVDDLAFGYFGTASGSREHPYWGRRVSSLGEFRGNSTAIGFFTLILMILGAVGYFRKRDEVPLFVGIGIVALLLSFGHFWPGKPFFWIFYKLPLMSKFRVPEKFMVMVALVAAILAAYGMEFLRDLALSKKQEEKESKTRVLLIVSAALAGIALLWLGILQLMRGDLSYSVGTLLKNPELGKLAATNAVWAVLRFFGFSSVLVLLSALLWKAPEGKKVFWVIGTALIFFGVLDLWTINAPYKKSATVKVSDSYRADGVLSFLTREASGSKGIRVATSLKLPYRGDMRPYPVTGLRGYYLTYLFPYFGIESLDITAVSRMNPEYKNYFLKLLEGSVQPQLKTLNDLYAMNERLLQVSAVKYLISDVTISNTNLYPVTMAKGLDGRDHLIYEIKGALPRLSFYANYIVETNHNKALSLVSDPLVDFQKFVVVDNAGLKTRLGVPSGRMNLDVLEAFPGFIKTHINAPTDGVILHVSRYDKNWKAWVDGKEVPVFRANYIQQGIRVPAGDHQVEFRYAPSTAMSKVTLFMLLLSVALSLGLAVYFLIYPYREEY